MRFPIVLLTLVSICLPAVAADDASDKAEDALEALKQGKFSVNLRYRYETVADDTPLFMGRDGRASTLRTAVGYESAAYRGFKVALAFEDVTDLGYEDDHANAGAGSLNNGVTDRPGIPDPEITEINRATLSYSREQLAISAGRGEVGLGEQRFVGPVGWRQHHQTFDMLRVDVKAIPRTKLSYAFLDRAHRIFGDSLAMDTHVVMAEVDAGKAGSVTVYGLMLDYADPSFAGLSTDTYGARLKGKAKVSDRWAILYHAEAAEQTDAGDNPGNVDAGYQRLEIGAAVKKCWVRIGLEVLEGSAADGQFTTPLATLHKWQGWADKFLATPTDGIEQTYISAGGKWGRWTGSVSLLEFASKTGSSNYGTEIDAVVSYKASWGQTFALKAALYDAEDFSVDTDKLWAFTVFSF